ncbi:MAG: hypothetical protein HEQ39_19665 [Rhizobacter sp.]
MGLKKLLFCFLQIIFSFNVAAAEVYLEERPWPEHQQCSGCASIQYGNLLFQVNQSLVSKLFIPPGGNSSLVLLSDEVPPAILSIQIVDNKRLNDRYKKIGIINRHKIKTPRQFYELIGKDPGSDSGLLLARKAESISDAVSYQKFSRQDISIFKIKAKIEALDLFYVTVDGQDYHYIFSGQISNRLFESLLSNMVTAKMP